MGCGASKRVPNNADDRETLEIALALDAALQSHIAAAIGIAPKSREVISYVSMLRSEGCDTPTDFDELTIAELKEDPFCFKRLHLKKVARSREKTGGPGSERRQSSIRGQCNLCGENVLESQPRLKDPNTGLYQHEACQGGLGAAVPSMTNDHETTSAVSGSTQSGASSAPKSKQPNTRPLLPAGLKTRPLLPDGKHAFLSYQWDVQDQVKVIKAKLNNRYIKCWMDIDGGMKSDIYDSMAEGVQGAACVLCFMTQAYQDSANCKLELKFAQQSGVPIIPVMMQPDFKAKGWLGILTSGSIWTPMYDVASVDDGINKLIVQAQHLIPRMRGDDIASDTASESSGDGSSFDVDAWGNDIFSLDEMREELERLREETAPATGAGLSSVGVRETRSSTLCPLPAMVPTLPRGLYVTAEMERVLDAVLAQGDGTPSQIGFCGMGGIGTEVTF